MTTTADKPIKHIPRKPRGSGIGPYKLLVTLMYGQHKWIERDGQNIRIPLAKAALYMKSRVNRIPKYLGLLEDWGIIESIRINPYWATIRIRNPKGMIWAPIDVVEVVAPDYLILPGDTQGDEDER